jgi:hypothetical protein
MPQRKHPVAGTLMATQAAVATRLRWLRIAWKLSDNSSCDSSEISPRERLD